MGFLMKLTRSGVTGTALAALRSLAYFPFALARGGHDHRPALLHPKTAIRAMRARRKTARQDGRFAAPCAGLARRGGGRPGGLHEQARSLEVFGRQIPKSPGEPGPVGRRFILGLYLANDPEVARIQQLDVS